MLKSLEDYINELRDFKKRSNIPDEFTESADKNSGILSVAVTHSKGSFPIENARVEIFSADDSPIVTLYTDMSGKTGPIALKTVSKQSTETPESEGRKADLYHILVTADSYVTTRVENIPIYEGVTTVQQIDMTLLSASAGGATQIITQDGEGRV